MPDLQAALCRKAAPLFISGRSSRTPLRRGGQPLPCNPVWGAICFFREGCTLLRASVVLLQRTIRRSLREKSFAPAGAKLFKAFPAGCFSARLLKHRSMYTSDAYGMPRLRRTRRYCSGEDRPTSVSLRTGAPVSAPRTQTPRRDSGSGYASASGRRTAAYSSFRLRPV